MTQFLVEVDSERRPELEVTHQEHRNCFDYDRELRRQFPGKKVTVNTPQSNYFHSKYDSPTPGCAAPTR